MMHRRPQQVTPGSGRQREERPLPAHQPGATARVTGAMPVWTLSRHEQGSVRVWGPSVPAWWWRWTPMGRRRTRGVLRQLRDGSQAPTPKDAAALDRLLRRYGG